MKYTVKATYTTSLKVDVEAKDINEAHQVAKDMPLSQFEQVKDSGVLKLFEIEVSNANFTDEQLAFIKAYSTNVAVADDHVVKAFVLSDDHDEFYKDHSDTYSGLADAHGVWRDAKNFFAQELAKKFYTGEKSE
jgi:hypothetical protein